MSDFIIITKARVLENEPEEIIKEQEEKRKVLGLGDKNFLCHFHSSPYTSDRIVEMPIEFAIQHLAIKEGYDMVQFPNGNYGFVAYYNGVPNGFEIIG